MTNQPIIVQKNTSRGINVYIKYGIMCQDSVNKNFYDLETKDTRGRNFPFSQLRGKVVLIVNVASNCGFTPQYRELEELYTKYRDQGFIILGFPCNQFGHQDPGTNEEIQLFCEMKFGVNFPILQKINVNGPYEDEVYTFLKSKKTGLLGLKGIRWNFEKFLVDRNGEVYKRYISITTPKAISEDIEHLLAQKAQ